MSQYKAQTTYPKYDWDDIENIDAVVDDLGRETIARAIAQELRGGARPRILGVYGWWGSGKSVLLTLTMRQILADNERDKNLQIIACPFNPWHYELEGDLAPGLIRALCNLEEKFKGRSRRNPALDPKKYKSIAKSLLNLVLEVGPILLPDQPLVSTAGKGATKAIEFVEEAHEKGSEEPPRSAVDHIHEQMQALVNAILNAAYEDSEKQYRLAVFIDDLDRCSPENMVRMFEWLKVHLRVEGCTYVLALDHVAAARAIEGRYKDYLTDEEDVAYGFRYLEKLVDNEYELQLAPKVELMALRQVYGRNTLFERLSDAARETCGADFPGIQNMNRLLELRSLLTPRTMLKIVYRFKRAMEVINSDEAEKFRNQLSAAYPFWILFLIAMYYRLRPRDLDDFIRARGKIHDLMKHSETSVDWGTGPMREFCQYAARLRETAGAGMELPPPEILARLALIIRENTFTEDI